MQALWRDSRAALFLTVPESADPALSAPPGVFVWNIACSETRINLGINLTGKPFKDMAVLADSAKELLSE